MLHLSHTAILAWPCFPQVHAITGAISTVAGNTSLNMPLNTYTGDGGPATNASLNMPIGLAFNTAGDLFIVDAMNKVVRRSVCAIGFPHKTIHTCVHEYWIPTHYNTIYLLWVCRVDATTGIISTVAGSFLLGKTQAAYSGDGGPATNATLSGAWGIVIDAAGSLFISDTKVIHKVTM